MRKKHLPRFIGAKFSEWTVISGPRRKAPCSTNPAPPREWLCRCSCGFTGWVPDGNLSKGYSTRCAACGHDSRDKAMRARTLSRLRSMVGKKTTRGARILRALDLGDAYELTVECAECGGDRHLESPAPRVLLSASRLCHACATKKRLQKYPLTCEEAGLSLGVSRQRVGQIIANGGWPAVESRLNTYGKPAKAKKKNTQTAKIP